MSFDTCNVTGTLYDTSGKLIANRDLLIKRDPQNIVAISGGVVVPDVIEASTNAAGAIITSSGPGVDLALGRYIMSAQVDAKTIRATLTIDSLSITAGTADLSDVIQKAPAPEIVTAAQIARDEAQAAATAAESSATDAAASADEAEAFASVSPRIIYVADFAALAALDTSILPAGQLVYAGDIGWKLSVGATDIPGASDWVPVGAIYDEHFGVNADMTWTDNGSGPELVTGTSDTAAINAALAYASSVGLGIVHSRSDLYLTGEIVFPVGAALIWTNNFESTIWQDYSERQNGFDCPNRNKIVGVNIVAQHNTATKEPDRGDEGNAIRLGGDFMTTTAQTVKGGFYVDVRITRAADVVGQESYPSPEIAAIHNIDGAYLRLGSHTTTNVKSSYKYLSHWSGYNATADALLEPTATYHARNVKIDWAGTITGAERVVGLSAVANHDVSGFTCDGVPSPVLILAGDNTDQFTVADQEGLPGKGIRFGFIHAVNCGLGAGEKAISVTSRGTSKWDDYAGTSIKKIDQLEIDVVFAGAWVEITGGAASTTAVRGFGIHGRCDFGRIWETGATQSSVEIEYGNGHVSFELMSGTIEARVEYRRNTSILGSAVDLGSDFATDYCVRIVGDTDTDTLGAAATKGDTTITLTGGFTQDVHIGDKILVGAQPVTATAFIQDGVTTLQVTPLLANVASGTVTLDRRTTVDRFVANYRASEKGALIDYADVERADFTNVAITGRYLAELDNTAVISIEGTIPAVSCQITTASDYNFILRPGCVAYVTGGTRVPHNSEITATFLLQRFSASGPWAQLIAHGAVIEDVSNFYSAPAAHQQVKMRDCVDFDGDEVDSPDHVGTWTPVVERNTSGTTDITATVNSSQYQIDGKFITVEFKVTIDSWPAAPAGSEYVVISGFPIGMTSAQEVIGQLAADNGTGTLALTSNDAFLLTDAANNKAIVYRQATSGIATVKDDEIGNGNILWGNLRYRWRA